MCSAYLYFTGSFFPFSAFSLLCRNVADIQGGLVPISQPSDVCVRGRDTIDWVGRWPTDKGYRIVFYSRLDSLLSSLLQHRMIISHTDAESTHSQPKGLEHREEWCRVWLPPVKGTEQRSDTWGSCTPSGAPGLTKNLYFLLVWFTVLEPGSPAALSRVLENQRFFWPSQKKFFSTIKILIMKTIQNKNYLFTFKRKNCQFLKLFLFLVIFKET